MSLIRTAARGVVRAPTAAASIEARRLASSSAHDEHHHDEHHNDTTYRPEGFHSRGWIYSIVAFAGIAAFYKYAPAPGEGATLTRWIKSWAPDTDWKAYADNHLALSAQSQDHLLTTQGARRPSMYRMKTPQSMALPYSAPVGHEVDFTGVKVKGYQDL